jgi:hypothetical protein
VSFARQRLVWLGAVVLTILCGLAWRRPEIGLPWAVAKYGGSVLWGAMVFFCLASARPQLDLRWIAVAAAAIAALVELSQSIHYPPLDAFRATTAGALLLGRTFDPLDILAYWAGVAGALLCAYLILHRRG